MNTQMDLLSALENVIARFPRPDRRPVGTVTGMALPLSMDGKAPKRMMVFPLGEPPSNDDRKWKFTKADLQRTVADFQTRTEPLPVFYEHGDGPRGKMAAGWIDSVDLAADGLYASIRWTDTAQKEIESGEWAFRSPAWNGEEDGLGFICAGPLSHIGLVNDPAIGGLAPNVASKSVASSQPSTSIELVPLVKEQIMANEVTAAKTKAAVAIDKAGVLDAIKAAYPGCEVFGDDVLSDLISDVLEGGVEDAPDAPGAKPAMPGADAKPPAPAVPLFTSAEDVAKVEASATAQADELKKANEQIASQEARLKTLEGRELSGKIINASATDRKPGQLAVPTAPTPGDYVGASIAAFDQRNAPTHQAAVAYREKALATGKTVTYREALIAVTRKTA